jgi:Domain of unknown function (DUF4124)
MHVFSRFFSAEIGFNQKNITGTIAMSKFLLILLILASTNTYAVINKWVDDQGQVHYSDEQPPSQVKPKTLREGSSAEDSARSGTAATKSVAEREAELKKEQAEKKSADDKAERKKAAEDALKANCDVAQENLRALQSGVRIMDINANGERSYIDDTQRQQRIDTAQQAVKNYCK